MCWINCHSSRVTRTLSGQQGDISQTRVTNYKMDSGLPKRVNRDDIFLVAPPFNRIWPEIIVVCFILQGIADHFETVKYHN